MDPNVATVLIRASVSGVLGTLLSVMFTGIIYKFGGALGGILSSAPSLLIPSTVGIILQYYNDEVELSTSMFAIPIGSIILLFYVFTWKIVLYYPEHWGSIRKLILTVVITYCVWGSLTVSVLYTTNYIKEQYNLPHLNVYIGLSCFAFQLFLGPFLLYHSPDQPPPSTAKINIIATVLRSFFVFCVVFTAVTLVLVDPTASGLATSFPAVFPTTIINIWLSQGPEYALGTLGPLISGCISGPIYTTLLYSFIQLFRSNLDMIPSIAVSASLAFIAAVVFGTISARVLVACRNKLKEKVKYATYERLEDEDETLPLIRQKPRYPSQ
jgi:MFS family permease